MRVVMGELNGVRLLDLMNASVGKCNRVTAAVAYASQTDPFFEHCKRQGVHLEFFGLLDDTGAVSRPVLRFMLDAGPLAFSPRLIKGHFHSKIIWWHGFGAYIGSANLTSNAWFTNVECGLFFEESEILGQPLQIDLELQFEYLRSHSVPVTNELLKALEGTSVAEQHAYQAQRALSERFDGATSDIPAHSGLTAYGPSIKTTGYTRFTTEWNETLELLRGLCGEFQALGQRPEWVDADAHPTVHFDQFLHAYYYDYMRKREHKDHEESARSIELVNQAYQRNKGNRRAALEDAARWWASLPEAPYGEDVFIRDTAPRIRQMFTPASIAEWQLKGFQEAFYEVHAFKMHARQVKNAMLGLAADFHGTLRERSDLLARWLWQQPREPGQMHIRELVLFVIWGESPGNIAERLWLATTAEAANGVSRYAHLGQSTLGEAIGWARPDTYPPRNNRTNKALKSLGHDVRLFGD